MAYLEERKARYEYECRNCGGTIAKGELHKSLEQCHNWPHTRKFHLGCWND